MAWNQAVWAEAGLKGFQSNTHIYHHQLSNNITTIKRFISIWVKIIHANILCIMSILFREASRICSIHVSIWFSMGSNRSYREIHSQFVTIWYLDMSWWEGKQPKHVNEIVMLHLQKLSIHAMLFIERLFDW